MGENVRAHVVVTGIVQGVFFRVETKRAADQIGITGWVRNRSDGAVEAIFEGEKEKVADAIKWCHHGSAVSRVDRVEVTYMPFEGAYDRFIISY
jgi:acylphosphatase